MVDNSYIRVSPSEEKKIFDSQYVEIISEAEYEEIRVELGYRYVVKHLICG